MILITGASGMLGSTLVSHLLSRNRQIVTHAHTNNAHKLADLSDVNQTLKLLDEVRPKIIVNLIGLTSVERCQDHPHEAYLILSLIHISEPTRH